MTQEDLFEQNLKVQSKRSTMRRTTN